MGGNEPVDPTPVQNFDGYAPVPESSGAQDEAHREPQSESLIIEESAVAESTPIATDENQQESEDIFTASILDPIETPVAPVSQIQSESLVIEEPVESHPVQVETLEIREEEGGGAPPAIEWREEELLISKPEELPGETDLVSEDEINMTTHSLDVSFYAES